MRLVWIAEARRHLKGLKINALQLTTHDLVPSAHKRLLRHMGNNQSQEYEDVYGSESPRRLASPQRPVSTHSSPRGNTPSKWCGTTGICNPTHLLNDRRRLDRLAPIRPPHSRSTGTNTQQSVYEASSLYRRKMYAESQPHFRSRPPPTRFPQSSIGAQFRGPRTTLPPIQAGDVNVTRHQQIGVKPNRSGSAMPKLTVSRPLVSVRQIPSLVTQQLNGNNWADVGSDTGLESCYSPHGDSLKRATTIMPLPPLTSLRQIMEKFDSEMATSKMILKKGVEKLTSSEMLVGRSTQEQKELLTKTEESVMNTQTLLAKIHQHIANTHEFCNLLHRIDESLQTFSKAAYTVASWEKLRADDSLHSPQQ